ncbi:hypothetical protein [Bergeriella denitrificans]|uniref:Uncharacterized protein n=1 Tax=Bergeriella denitrificans TaxID=494 RepID=A0A378UKZ6_BERDE|nr:hypothetical protein [Bergeriella denitrificans]STZ77373.1 Uncharacterised protein [Bergeriella denitrificans]
MKQANQIKIARTIEQVRGIQTNIHRARHIGIMAADNERIDTQVHIIKQLYSEIDTKTQGGEKEDHAVEQAIQQALYRVQSWQMAAA